MIAVVPGVEPEVTLGRTGEHLEPPWAFSPWAPIHWRVRA
jgi:hypothetical protein